MSNLHPENQTPTKSVAITQPNFLPWLGYFEMIDRVDLFVFLDDVQYPTARHWLNRNRILSAKKQGWDWVTVSIDHKCNPGKLINQTCIADPCIWQKPLWNKIESSYGRARFYADYALKIKDILSRDHDCLSAMSVAVVRWAMDVLGITTRTILSSELGTQGTKDDKLLAIVRKVGGDFYLSNNGSMPYIRPDLFRKAGIGFEFQNFEVLGYDGFDPEILPPLSFVDPLFRLGPKRCLEIIRSGRSKKTALGQGDWS